MSDKKNGRPTVMTGDTIAKLENAFSMGCSDAEACLLAEINKATLYRYQHDNPDFCDRKDLLKQKLVLKARSVLAKALNDGDEKTAMWYLERKKKDEFGTRTELTGAGGGSISVSQNLDIEKLKELRAMIDK